MLSAAEADVVKRLDRTASSQDIRPRRASSASADSRFCRQARRALGLRPLPGASLLVGALRVSPAGGSTGVRGAGGSHVVDSGTPLEWSGLRASTITAICVPSAHAARPAVAHPRGVDNAWCKSGRSGHAAAMTLRVRQYVYLAVYSSVMTASEMASVIGLAADRATVRGSKRSTEPPVPRHHSWAVVCDDAGLQIHEQLGRLIARLRPHQRAIADLVDDLHDRDAEVGGARLQVVRFLDDDDDGETEDTQPGVLGWHLGQDILQFALDLRADIDIDEYDYSQDDE